MSRTSYIIRQGSWVRANAEACLKQIQQTRADMLVDAIAGVKKRYASKRFFKKVLTDEQALFELKRHSDFCSVSEYGEIQYRFGESENRLKKLLNQSSIAYGDMYLCTEDTNLLTRTYKKPNKGC
jgi:phosphoglucomutase